MKAGKFSFSSLRVRLMVLVLASVVPAVVLTLYSAIEQRRNALRDAQEHALRTAKAAAVKQQQMIEASRQLLRALVRVNDLRGSSATAAEAFLADLLTANPAYLNFGVIESNGDVFASAIHLENPLNLADRAYFKRAIETKDFVAGEYQIGRIHGKPSINFAQPILRRSGEVHRVLFASLDLKWMEQVAEEAQLPKGAVIFVVDRTGRILSRYPKSVDGSEQNLVGNRVTIVSDAMLREPEGFMRSDVLDGVPRLFGFVTLIKGEKGVDAALAVGIPEAKAYAAAKTLLRRNLSLLGLVMLAAVLAAWFLGDAFVLRQVRTLVAATRRLQEGDLTARSGFASYQGELGELAHALDEMAVGLEQRSVERQRAAGALRALNVELERRVKERTDELAQKNEQMSADLEMAREFQFAFLPHHYPSFPKNVPLEKSKLQFRHLYRPSGTVGGDFFDILPINDSQAGILICDVMGHGVRAALVTALIRGLVEDLRSVAADPGVFLTEVNRTLAEVLRQTGRTMFASAFYMVVDITTGQITYTTAGHPSVLHLHAAMGEAGPVKIPRENVGPVLGLFPDAEYATTEALARAGDTLLFFTDGVYELTNAANEVFTYERFEKVVRRWCRLPVATMFDEMMIEIKEFAGAEDFRDDICLIAVHLPRDAQS
jgi:serine phosphatase RsbU (regulator of sigma subunit)